MDRSLAGPLAGFAATAPMTLAMELLHRGLPERERYPLPPRQVAMNVAAELGAERHLDEPQRVWLTLLSHFAYGAAAGAVYAPLARRLPQAPAVKGTGFGLAVWAGSYLGLLPALGLLSPATEHPPRRNTLMIAAHVVWGAAAGVLVDQFEKTRHS